jgi:hypothetical protein
LYHKKSRNQGNCNLILHREKEIEETERRRGAVMRDNIFYGGNRKCSVFEEEKYKGKIQKVEY